ncbi:MAG: tetratricopeptide repeat protein [Proteobacteria bacterium]|nr:tetratricopeptide repeat protein [Pseudomonadota bacterium]
MRTLFAAYRLLLLGTLSLLSALTESALAKQRYSQIVLPFPDDRTFSYRFEPSERALVLEIQKTNPSELEALYHYDESVVRRVFFKDLGGQGAEVRMVLRDDAIRVMINSYQEPFRITIDFFDSEYKENNDPTTGLPLIPLNVNSSLPDDRPLLAETKGSEASPNEATVGASSQENLGKRRLLQPQPEVIRNPQELLVKLNDTTGGLGLNWKTYPPYIYRVQIATFKTGKNYETWLKQNAGKALSSSEALAQYAGQLFDFGHESRALVAYQKVLHESPSVFDRSAEHIWKLAEIHLGQGNLTLADGYYESLKEKHSDNPLASFAALRRLDIKAIRAAQRQKADELAALGSPLESILIRDNPGLAALVALRRAYWQIPQTEIARLLPEHAEPPAVGPNTLMKLEETRSGADSPRTAFLIDSIILANQLKNNTWNIEIAKQAGEYFDRYKGKATEPFRPLLMNQCEQSILASVDKMLKSQQYPEIIGVVESLPHSLDELRNTNSVSWAAAESYRRIKQPNSSIPYYETAAKTSKNKPDQFRSWFWLLQATMGAVDNQSTQNNHKDLVDRLQKKMHLADKNAWESWKTLIGTEKALIFAEIKPNVEQNIKAPHLVQTPPKILLEIWDQKLATETPSAETPINNTQAEAQPSSRVIYILADLSKRFEQLGMDSERKSTKQLLRRINFKSKQPEKEALRVWTDELTQLAEEYRRNNDYLEAGRLFALTGSENNQWEGRAEALYKGGLLLYRSGRRDEAMAALQKAADDGNNLLYAELAKKRLEKIQK